MNLSASFFVEGTTITRKAIALALALAFPVPALAATYYVNYTTGLDTNNGTSAGTAWKTLSKASATLVAGDICRIAANDTIYAHPIVPRAHSTTWIGDSTARHTVKVPGITNNKRHTLVNGIRFFGTLGSSYLNSDSTGYAFHARNCEAVGGFYATARAWTLDNVRVGIGRCDYTAAFRYSPDSLAGGDSCAFRNSTANLRYATQSPPTLFEYMIYLEPQRVYGPTMERWNFANNTCTLTVASGQRFDKMAMWNHIRRGTFTDNSWLIRDSSGSSSNYNVWVLRDSMKENKFRRDTYEFWAPNGLGGSMWMLYSAGSARPDSFNTWSDCTFKSNISKPLASFQIHWPAGVVRDSIYRNTIVCNTGNPCVHLKGAKDSLYFDRNTVVNTGNGQALLLEPDGNTSATWGGSSGRIRMLGNIFYTRGSSGAVYFNGVPTWADSLIKSDFNLYFAPIPNGQDKAFRFTRWGQSPATFRKVGEVNGSRLEYNSTWGSPLFEDSTYATFDGDIGQASRARGVGVWGLDAGAKAYAAPPPSDVDDLAVSTATSESIVLTWTAPGANGDVGTATSYTFKYSTTEFTADNFDTNGNVVSTSSPQAAGLMETLTVEPLASNTTYYFAVKATNGTSTSGISNVASGRTYPAGSIEP